MSLSLRYRARELRELGWGGSAFRIGWELKRRTGFFEKLDRPPHHGAAESDAFSGVPTAWRELRFFTSLERMFRFDLNAVAHKTLVDSAVAAAAGEIVCFSDERRAHGLPVAWHHDPVTGNKADPKAHWSRALGSSPGDVKDLWEAGRFPHAYTMTRAAAFEPARRGALGEALRSQVRGFLEDNPFAKGVHWASGQEIAFRLFAWKGDVPLGGERVLSPIVDPAIRIAPFPAADDGQIKAREG